jgi:hypothetical protein
MNDAAPVTIYANGCTGCGIVGHHIRRVKRHHPNAIVKNSRYDKDARAEHAAHLKGLAAISNYQPIVVEAGKVTPLFAWKPQD